MADWSYSDANSSHSYDIPDGVYPAKIINCDFEAASSKGLDMWKFTLKLAGIKSAFYHNIIVEPTGKLTQPIIRSLIANMGVCFRIPEGSTNWEDWYGGVGIVEIYHKEVDGVSYPRAKFFPPEKGREALIKFRAKKEAEKAAVKEFEDFSSEFAGVDNSQPGNIPASANPPSDHHFGERIELDGITF